MSERSPPLYLAVVVIMACIVGTNTVEADGGMVPVNYYYLDIPIHEPGQKAILCWDGSEEILVLGTDVSADQEMTVLQIVPFPSEPSVRLCNNSIFEMMKTHVERTTHRMDAEGGKGFGDSADAEEPIDVEVVFHRALGIHDITVIKALTEEGFAQWVNDFLVEAGLEPIDVPDAQRVAGSYIDRGINYFLLDLQDLGPDVASSRPLMFRFHSSSVFYPMEISSLIGGDSRILLFIVTPHETLSEPRDETEWTLATKTDMRVRKERVIEVERPGSPVDFELITHQEVHLRDLEYDARSYAYMYEDELFEHFEESADTSTNMTFSDYRRSFGREDTDIWQIYEFFEDHDSVMVSVYEYEGTIDLTGDIDISEFSSADIVISETVEPNYITFIFLLEVPVIVLGLLILAYHMRRRGRRRGRNGGKEKDGPDLPPPVRGP